MDGWTYGSFKHGSPESTDVAVPHELDEFFETDGVVIVDVRLVKQRPHLSRVVPHLSCGVYDLLRGMRVIWKLLSQ